MSLVVAGLVERRNLDDLQSSRLQLALRLEETGQEVLVDLSKSDLEKIIDLAGPTSLTPAPSPEPPSSVSMPSWTPSPEQEEQEDEDWGASFEEAAEDSSDPGEAQQL